MAKKSNKKVKPKTRKIKGKKVEWRKDGPEIDGVPRTTIYVDGKPWA